jgi:hypothetical protein
MKKFLLLLAAMLLATPPASAQVVLPQHYEYQFRADARFYKNLVVSIGKGGQLASVHSTLFRLNAPLSSSTSGAVTAGITLPANTLVSNGKGLHIKVWGTTAANANNKTINVKFGSTTIAIMSAVAANNKDFAADLQIYRTGSNAQQINVSGYANNALLTGLGTTSTQTETSTIAVQVQLPTSTGAADVVVTGFTIFGDSGY